MGFELIVWEPYYARLRSAVGDTTFSVHVVGEISGPSHTVVYFECQLGDWLGICSAGSATARPVLP